MNWEMLGAAAELLGAIGVIGSVLYLASQIRGDKEATLANTRQMRQTGVRELLLHSSDSEHIAPILAKIGEPIAPVKALMSEFDLSREEAQRLGVFNLATMRQLETNLRMQMTDDEFQQTLNTIRGQLKGQCGVWWKEAGDYFSQSFIDQVENIRKELA